MTNDWPVLVLTLTVWAYWGTVILLVLYKRVRHGQSAGVVPRRRWEKRLWWGVVAVFLAWNTLPALAATLRHGPFALPAWAASAPAVSAARCGAAALGVACYLATLSCWLLMGRSWSMAIVPGRKTELITGGLFGWVRHPIYSMSILLMLCTAAVVANAPMALVAALHVAVLNVKARKEEEHLTAQHGPAYGGYCRRVGRFVPRLRGPVGRRSA
jgi:protein-S-isoprenylcysteine O-methyltransferase Ste14